MSQTTTILPINPTTFELQDYSTQDTSLISNFTVEPTFDPSTNLYRDWETDRKSVV